MTKLENVFAMGEQARACRWKASTGTLPDAARVPAAYVDRDGALKGGPYEYCIPPEFATLTLLPEVRDQMVDLFEQLGIPWHPSGSEPSNHLLSSQAQCVNALGQMVRDPDRVVRAFSEVLGTRDVLEIEPDRFLTFEYIGDRDYFHEGHNGVRVRGSMCTSVDAAFLHRTAAGVVELVLVEWKYTEAYTPKREPEKVATRRRRYEAALHDPEGPLRPDLLEFEDLLDEPLYQMMRQQLLADRLERDRTHGADVVRVVHVHPTANHAYQRSLRRPTHRALGATVDEVWSKLLRRPDRFMAIDNRLFLDPLITSDEYCARYGDTLDAR